MVGWLVLARVLFGLQHISDLAAAGGRTWLGLAMIAVALASLVVIAVARLGETAGSEGTDPVREAVAVRDWLGSELAQKIG